MRDKTSFMQFLLTISLSETTVVKIPRNWVAWWRHSMNDNKQHTAEAHRKLDGMCIVLLTSCRNTISNKYTANRFDFFLSIKIICSIFSNHSSSFYYYSISPPLSSVWTRVWTKETNLADIPGDWNSKDSTPD